MIVNQALYYLLHLLHRIDLTLVGSEWSQTYPRFRWIMSILVDNCGFILVVINSNLENLLREQTQVSSFFWEERSEVHLYRITQLGKDIGVILEGRRLLLHHLAGRSHQLALSLAMLVDMCHLEVGEVEAHAQIAGAQNAVKVGYRGKLLGDESAIECIETFYTLIFPLRSASIKPTFGARFSKNGRAKERLNTVILT